VQMVSRPDEALELAAQRSWSPRNPISMWTSTASYGNWRAGQMS